MAFRPGTLAPVTLAVLAVVVLIISLVRHPSAVQNGALAVAPSVGGTASPFHRRLVSANKRKWVAHNDPMLASLRASPHASRSRSTSSGVADHIVQGPADDGPPWGGYL